MTSPLSLFKNILGVKDAVITKIDGGDDTSDCHVYLRPRLHTLGKCVPSIRNQPLFFEKSTLGGWFFSS